MHRKIFYSLSLALVLVANALAQKIETPTLTPSELTAAQQNVVRQVVVLRKEKKYDEAIQQITAVLAENPNSPIALYNAAFVYYLKPDYPKALETVHQAARYKSSVLRDAYTMMGSIYDDSKNPQKAVEVYQFAVKQFPEDYLLHYNLGLTLYRQTNFKESRESMKRAVALNRNHSSSQLMLADIFYKGQYRVPALFAAMNFFLLEPNTNRTGVATQIISNVLQGGATAGAKPNEVNIAVGANSPKDEGDFAALELALGLSKAAAMSKEENKGKTEAQMLARQLETFIAILDESKNKDASKFVWKQYAPLFVEMKNRRHIETLANMLCAKAGDTTARKWLTENSSKLDEFADWLESYQPPITK